MISKFESSKFQNCPSKTEILQLYFKIANSESESQQIKLQLNEREQKGWILPRKFCGILQLLYTFINCHKIL
jgi:hypothetical protein